MPHDTPLISTIVIGLVAAFALGAIAHRLRVPPLVGYLLAGVAIGPFTPGFVADQKLAQELADIGVILLMFGVGLQFSLRELWSVRAIAVPGAVIQITCVTLLGMATAYWMGWNVGAGLVFGVALSVASTVVVLRSLQERRLLGTERGHIAVGWLIVEDIVMVCALVLLPSLAGVMKGDADASALAWAFAATAGKIFGFIVVMVVLGRRVIPWMLHYMAHTGSRELFRLSVLSIALGVAYGAAQLFDVSFAVGAFFAGAILSESALSQRAAQEALPLRDAFAVLFFVSVGMLFDPGIIVREPWPMVATVLIIVVVKSAVAFGVVRLLGRSHETALMLAATRTQIGEFSIILAALGVSLALMPESGRDLILAGVIISILLTPLAFVALDRLSSRPPEPATQEAAVAEQPVETPMRHPIPVSQLTDHIVLVGHGRVGKFVSDALVGKGAPLLVIEDNADLLTSLRGRGIDTIHGNAADPEVVRAANLEAARVLFVAIPDAFESGQVVEQARFINPTLRIFARAHSEPEAEHLDKHGATVVIMGEREIAKAMLAALA
jgi:monovalent cation:H+ antiporter-2, CPA2 family